MVGILIPSNFSEDLLNGKSAKIMTFYDDIQSSPMTSAKSAVSEILTMVKSAYLIKLAEGKLGVSTQIATNIVAPMGFKYRLVGNPTKNTSYFMVEGIALTLLQLACAMVGAAISEKKSYKKLILKGMIVSILSFISAFICVYIQIRMFNTPYRGSIWSGGILILSCCIGWTFFGVLLNLLNKGDKVKAITSTSAISTTMVLSGYTYPIIAMPKVFKTISKLIPNTHFIVPFRDVSLLGSTFEDVMQDIIWLNKFAIFMIVLVTIKFLLNKRVEHRNTANIKIDEDEIKGEAV